MTIVSLLQAHIGLALAIVALVLTYFYQHDKRLLHDIASGVFLDIEKRVEKEAIDEGPDQMTKAIQEIIDLLPARLHVLLDAAAFLLRTTPDQLAARIAQDLYDEIRSHAANAG